jgi:hypothetical protein
MSDEPVDVGEMFEYEVPEVIWRPVLNESNEVTGYKVDPEFDPLNWDQLTMLRHYAALIEHRTGMKVRVGPGETPEPPEGIQYEKVYHILTGHMTGGPAPYEVTWAWLSGFEGGVNELLWKASQDAKKQSPSQ